MSGEKKFIVLVNGSPKLKAENSVSESLSQLFMNCMESTEIDYYRVHVRDSLKHNKTKEDFEAMLKADAIIFTFPLYIFCVPGILMRFLQDFCQYWKQEKGYRKKVKIYAVVNCGFPEAYINEEAVRVIRSFGRQTGAESGLGIMIGSGGMLAALDNPLVRKVREELIQAYRLIAEDIFEDKKGQKDLISIRVKFPTRLYYFMGNKSWYDSGRKYGLRKKDLYRKPYLHP